MTWEMDANAIGAKAILATHKSPSRVSNARIVAVLYVPGLQEHLAKDIAPQLCGQIRYRH